MSPKVIVVEDNSDLLFLYKTALEGKGFEVHAAHNVAQVMALIESMIPDLIFLDIEMPGETGVGVVDHLRDDPQFASTRIVVVTANDRWRERVGDKVDAFLVKPIGIAQLMALADQLTQG
ncbi:MAG: response regulator [Anaerolinea sp.]|nr:response regulator [Anaerolinea sp.]MCC6973961.1 response regulator [Anaerolineae bacterium]CAG0952568.1 Polar-differentiation response regulator DivK [Anaerolineae bacterium]